MSTLLNCKMCKKQGHESLPAILEQRLLVVGVGGGAAISPECTQYPLHSLGLLRCHKEKQTVD